MNTLFNTQDNQEFLGIRSDASLNKANKKGTPQYEEWLRKYREKRGAKAKPEDAAKEKSASKDILNLKELTQKAENFVKDFATNDKSELKIKLDKPLNKKQLDTLEEKMDSYFSENFSEENEFSDFGGPEGCWFAAEMEGNNLVLAAGLNV